MTILESIKNLLLGNNQEKDSPEGYCPNCWGTQQYSGKFYEAIKNEGIDLDHISLKKGWIQDYVDKNLSDIKLQTENENLVCQHCKVSFKPSE